MNVLTCLDALKISLLLGEKCAHPLVYTFDNALCGLLVQLPVRQAFLLVCVDLGHQLVRRLVDALDGGLSGNVNLLA